MTEVKVLFVGPKDSGKTALANFIADAVPSGGVNASVEVWDISGDRQYEGGWPAARHNGIGAVFVYNPENSGEDKDLDQWHKWFAEPLGLKESQCLVLAHYKNQVGRFKPPSGKAFAKVQCVQTTLQENQNVIKEAFDKFLGDVVAAAQEKREKEEQSLLN